MIFQKIKWSIIIIVIIIISENNFIVYTFCILRLLRVYSFLLIFVNFLFEVLTVLIFLPPEVLFNE